MIGVGLGLDVFLPLLAVLAWIAIPLVSIALTMMFAIVWCAILLAVRIGGFIFGKRGTA